MTRKYRELSVKELRRVCDPDIFHFSSTAELPVLNKIIGQERAVRATTFGIDIESPGYHIFALGPAGTGKTTMIKDLLDRRSTDRPVPDDYVSNVAIAANDIYGEQRMGDRHLVEVKFVEGGRLLQGRGMEYNNESRELLLRSDVQAVFGVNGGE